MSHKNRTYLKFVRSLPCAHCRNPETEPHHIIGIGMGAMGDKADDIHSMPLCRSCHDAVHEKPAMFQLPQVRWMIKTQGKAQEEGEI